MCDIILTRKRFPGMPPYYHFHVWDVLHETKNNGNAGITSQINKNSYDVG